MWDVTARYEDTPLARGEGFGADSERFIRRAAEQPRDSLCATPRRCAAATAYNEAIVYNVNESPAHREAVASARGAVAAELSKAALAAGRADLAVKFSSEEESSAASCGRRARAVVALAKRRTSRTWSGSTTSSPAQKRCFRIACSCTSREMSRRARTLFAVCVTPAKTARACFVSLIFLALTRRALRRRTQVQRRSGAHHRARWRARTTAIAARRMGRGSVHGDLRR